MEWQEICWKLHFRIFLVQRSYNSASNETNLFQYHIDDSLSCAVKKIDREGMSNCIHLLGAGHFLYIIEKYDCLNLYSQQ